MVTIKKYFPLTLYLQLEDQVIFKNENVTIKLVNSQTPPSLEAVKRLQQDNYYLMVEEDYQHDNNTEVTYPNDETILKSQISFIATLVFKKSSVL
jgi:hypothetical protein